MDTCTNRELIDMLTQQTLNKDKVQMTTVREKPDSGVEMICAEGGAPAAPKSPVSPGKTERAAGIALVVWTMSVVLISLIWWWFSGWDEREALREHRRKNDVAATADYGIEMVPVAGGTFMMGCVPEQWNDCYDNERNPAHQVTLSGFSIGKYEVTQAQWKALMGNNPSHFAGDTLPVENVSWNDVQEFILKLNAATGKRYRLPTEAEWEYAARGGNKSKGYKYSGGNNLERVAWYYDNSGDRLLNSSGGYINPSIRKTSNNNRTHAVGTKNPNELGLYDMSGNVLEWCQDLFANDNYNNFKGPSAHPVRGGWWGDLPRSARVSARWSSFSGSSEYGFRLALSDEAARDMEARAVASAMEMVQVAGGTFMMGCTPNVRNTCLDYEQSRHQQVTVNVFSIGKYEVTQAQWKAVMGNNPSAFKGDSRPVERVNWYDVQEFIRRLNAATGKKYRLPTEAEWEYAARGGNESKGYSYSGGNDVKNVAWYYNNSGDSALEGSPFDDDSEIKGKNNNNRTHNVGTKAANELGLYDMSGNVLEWCQDWHGEYIGIWQTNPVGPAEGSHRVIRGGAWDYSLMGGVVDRRSSDPGDVRTNIGFRLAVSDEAVRTQEANAAALVLNAAVSSLDMVSVAGGTFMMGCTRDQRRDCDYDERPAHQVTLSGFSIGKYEVTQAQWKALMGNNPSYFKGDNRPVENVSWNAAQEFIRKLNQVTGKKYRLPTEAEWEYAARGGNKSKGYKYSGGDNVEDVAWYGKNSRTTHDVGTKAGNELGVYDMSGNIWEWCQDWYADYSDSSQTNPAGHSSSRRARVVRGGAWGDLAKSTRVSTRYFSEIASQHVIIGFRLVLSSE
jgi:formylglycine-generating enzyme required for sulfatase activity